ncbi:MAG: hypothetical protein K2P81_15685 [Bacteriovoracaceae bacterium]|nr:hypothetical protein [Bacteriovoracaceae bacterium]
MSVFDKKPLKPKTFQEALLGELNLESVGLSGEEFSQPEEKLTEKAVILESFTRFAEEKLAESPEGVVAFPGGEIVKKFDPSLMPYELKHSGLESWQQEQSKRMGSKIWSTLTQKKAAKPLIVFLGESLREEEALDEKGIQASLEFVISFNAPVAELFQKMVQAMKLQESEYRLMAIKDASGEKSTEELLEDIHWLSPQFVVPLGAQACQALLGSRERLASVHGKFFPVPRLETPTQICPLFHPSVIASNANMKKSTWADMQKLMKALGKT